MPINIQDYLLGRIPVGRKIDIPSYLMSKAASGGIQEVTGTLPLTVRSMASQVLKNYRFYGTASGAGVETESGEPTGYKLPITVTSNGTTTDYPIYIGDSKLGEEEYVDYESGKVYKRTENLAPFIDEWGNGYVSSTGAISPPVEDTQERYSPHIVIEPNATYQWAYQTGSFPESPPERSAWSGIGWYNDDGFISRNAGTVRTTLEVVAPANAKYAILSFRSFGENHNTMFIKSSTAPESYIPYLQPTDPPVPLPDITLPQGIATIDTEEEVKPQATIKGKIEQIT